MKIAKRYEGLPEIHHRSTPLYYLLKNERQFDELAQVRERFSSTGSTLLFDKRFEQRFTEIEKRICKVEKKTIKSVTQVVSTKVHDLASDEYELNEPIEVVLKFEEDYVIAVIPELGLHADGSNEIEAVSELKLELLDLFDDINEHADDELHTTPKSWKKIINKLIVKNGN